MSSERNAAITDGIIAIAATIMVLELEVPAGTDFNELLALWPRFLAHFTSFLLIFVLWFNHYLELKKFSFLSVRVVCLNALWLAFISLIPFSTGWISSYPMNVTAQVFYLVNLSLCFVFYRLIMVELVREKADTELEEIHSIEKAIPIYVGMLAAFVVAFFRPYWSMFIEFGIVIYNVVLILRYLGSARSH